VCQGRGLHETHHPEDDHGHGVDGDDEDEQ
jgi:hypothetical protein